jgi:hypothetical protein
VHTLYEIEAAINSAKNRTASSYASFRRSRYTYKTVYFNSSGNEQIPLEYKTAIIGRNSEGKIFIPAINGNNQIARCHITDPQNNDSVVWNGLSYEDLPGWINENEPELRAINRICERLMETDGEFDQGEMIDIVDSEYGMNFFSGQNNWHYITFVKKILARGYSTFYKKKSYSFPSFWQPKGTVWQDEQRQIDEGTPTTSDNEYEIIYDQLFADTPNSEYVLDIDGGEI